ncbi:Uma2 family endonuclease [Streptomyces echinatus]|uniref:Uma2 family endonuclease n=1 Tax=Streptomyces echinatus TaxID=67293 RepID=UPI00378D860D
MCPTSSWCRRRRSEAGTTTPSSRPARRGLVVEITSTVTARRDRGTKAAGYAEAGVPLYLLVDGSAPDGPAVTLYGHPNDGAYRVLEAGPFGAPVGLPAPFDLVLTVG